MPHIEDVLLFAISRKGKRYVFGAEADGNPDPQTLDCSEEVQWSCQQAGMLHVPDGAANQFAWCQHEHTAMSVLEAVHTRGALMFVTENTGRIGHVVFSLGDGTTMEAKGKAYGVGSFSAFKADGHTPRFDKAGLIPGVDYSTGHHPFPAGSADIGPGSKGAFVVLWQTMLDNKASQKLHVDGDFGAATEAATKLFQKIAGHPQSGRPSSDDWSTMFGLK